jgi:hypothetical protein
MNPADQRTIRRECYAEVVAFLEGFGEGAPAADEVLAWAKREAGYWRAMEGLLVKNDMDGGSMSEPSEYVTVSIRMGRDDGGSGGIGATMIRREVRSDDVAAMLPWLLAEVIGALHQPRPLCLLARVVQNFDDLYNVASEIAEMEETDFLGAADRLLSRWGRYDEEGA